MWPPRTRPDAAIAAAEQSGWIERVRRPGDGMARRYRITEAGLDPMSNPMSPDAAERPRNAVVVDFPGNRP